MTETYQFDRADLKSKYLHYAQELYHKPLGELDPNQLQSVIACVLKNHVIKPYFERSKEFFSVTRIAVYFSMEFLLGRIVLDALVNSGIIEMTRSIFEEEGIDINVLEDVGDTALGNGGLGRLAACFVESAATTGLQLFGFGIYYQYGFFQQQFDGHNQIEVKDDWTKDGDPWFEPDYDRQVVVNFNGTAVKAVPCVLPIIGYNKYHSKFKQNVFPLTLWKAEPIEGITNELASRISDSLYPNDSTDEGKKLRIYQEYFFASATMQLLVNTHLEKHGNLDDFEKYYCFQLNDTHPVLACVEYIRLLREHGYTFKQASEKAKKCFAYTNHTVMQEALETWRVDLFTSVVPASIFKTIQDLNQELIDTFIKMDYFQNDYGVVDWSKIYRFELTHGGLVHMARIACYVGNAINGVAAIHTQILKDTVLHDWFEVFPDKFFNCTNGVTPRRWLRLANPYLSKLLDSEINYGWTANLDELRTLEPLLSNTAVLKKFAECKFKAKQALADYILKHEGIEIDPNSIFDVQVKRIHEYKRQLMNAFRIIYLYDHIKRGLMPASFNVTFIIGGKAAPSYDYAKRVIALLKAIQDTINNDPDMEGKMKVVFVTNFNVSYGEKIYAAANFSEQISTAGTEASGTGNMKFMMNGAPTIGTLDGANFEIVHEAGQRNNYIFGATVQTLQDLHYKPREFMQASPEMQVILPYLTDGLLGERFNDIVETLRRSDKYYVMYDLQSYIQVSLRAFSDYAYEQETGIYMFHTVPAFENVIHSGKFSSDRTITEYANKIWHIVPVDV